MELFEIIHKTEHEQMGKPHRFPGRERQANH